MAHLNWVFNTSYKDQQYVDPNLHLLNHFNFETTENEISIREDSEYVILHNAVPVSKLKANSRSDWNNDAFHTFKFTQIGKVLEVSKPEILPYSAEEEKKNKYRRTEGLPLLKQRKRVVLKLHGEPLTANNKFDDLAYSLFSIHNYGKPISHFQRQVTSIGEKDFETIRKGWVYLYRTIFGKIANVLPFENRYEFSLIISREFDTIRFKGLPYQKLLGKLFEYIEARVHGRGHLITATDVMIKKISETINEDLSHIGFATYEQYSGESMQGDEIRQQAKLFDDLFNAYNELHIKSMLQIKDPQAERFDKLFEKREWPMNLN